MKHPQILIVEDESIVARDLSHRLTDMGYEVPAVSMTGSDAIHQVDRTSPDLVLMDIRLRGDMDGIEAAEVIRRRHSLPVVFVTAYADPQTLERAKQSTPFGYVLKPFVERELQTTIELALYKHQMDREREQLILELEEALSNVRMLNELLPICASCKRIREDTGYWMKLEAYLAKHADVEFTHTYCPECVGKLREEMGLPHQPNIDEQRDSSLDA